jgi:hypothetical protein
LPGQSTLALARNGGHESGEFLGRRPALQGQREALVVVVSFPGAGADSGRFEIIEALAPPEFFLVDPVTAFNLPVLLGAPRLDVAMPNPQRLDGERKGERKLLPVVPAESW